MTAIPSVPRQRETVLLVEDEDGVRGLLRHLLHGEGYRVLDAPGGPEALEICAQEPGPIDLLVTDVAMPVMTGQQLAETLCQRYPDLRVLFVSGYTDEAIVPHGVLQNRVTFMQKPFATTELVLKVREVLDAPRA